ncbi:MAG TPA: DUF4332 domain-containing protein [Pseudorhodoplanes sp.]|nr:DUF4332 domain-containing protein [Pseudorhodoplanes sp.]
MSYPLKSLGVIASEIAALKDARIKTAGALLEAAKTPKGRKELATATGLDPKRILELANKADHLRVKGLGKEYAELLRAAGVDTVRELKYRNPAKLAEAMAAANKKRKVVRLVPTDKAVGRWIEAAKKLPLKITY